LKVYLVWEIEDYMTYDVVKIFDDKTKADEWILYREKMTGNDYRIEEKVVE
jgi:hypothetical protein